MCVYGDPQHDRWFRKAWAKTGKKLDMGKSCVRIKKIEDVPLDVIGEAVKRVPVKKFVSYYESTLKALAKRPNKPAKGKTPSQKARKKR